MSQGPLNGIELPGQISNKTPRSRLANLPLSRKPRAAAQAFKVDVTKDKALSQLKEHVSSDHSNLKSAAKDGQTKIEFVYDSCNTRNKIASHDQQPRQTLESKDPLLFSQHSEQQVLVARTTSPSLTLINNAQLPYAPLPFPTRPGALHEAPLRGQFETASVGNISTGKNDHGPAEEEDMYVARVTAAGVLGYQPWKGNSKEDVLTEEVLKTGYSYKAPASNESNTARPSIWPHLRSNAGLHALSSLFVSALQQRRDADSNIPSSTFKPPPRVTLTDTKKEIWLRDLADTNIALRRLSRTIPHGIRGEALLDQCLVKRIPVARAVWLTKCVGANEIRAFKRKGVSDAVTEGHELNWIQDWTGLVEAFIENVINRYAQPEWKSKIAYALQLSSSLYAERLLEQDHWLRWLLCYFEDCILEKLTISIILIRIYFHDLTSTFANVKRLVAGCFSHFARGLSSSTNLRVLTPVTKSLHEMLYNLVTARPECFIVLHDWNQCRKILQSMHMPAGSKTSNAVHRVIERHGRLIKYSVGKKTTQSSINKMLDHVKFDVQMKVLTNRCLEMVPDAHELVMVLLHWCSSVYRSGSDRIYLVTGVIRELASQGHNTDSAILNTLATLRDIGSVQSTQIGRVVSELVRSHDFDVGHYLRWLVSTGNLIGCTPNTSSYSCAVQPILDIPLDYLPPNILTLRYSILHSIGVDASQESATLARVKKQLASQLPRLLNYDHQGDAPVFQKPPPVLTGLTMTMTSAVAHWIRGSIAYYLSRTSHLHFDDIGSSGEEFAIMDNEFVKVRAVMETFGDYSAFAEIILLLVDSSTADVLVSVLTTLSLHRQVFAAMGSMHGILIAILRRYRILRTGGMVSKELTFMLYELASRLPAPQSDLEELKQEITTVNTSLGIAVWTPVSDNLVEIPKCLSLDIEEEIDQLVANSTCADEATVSRLFRKVVLQLATIGEDLSATYGTVAALLVKLRGCDEETFDSVMSTWLRHSFQNANADHVEKVAPALVGSGCLTFSRLMACAQNCFYSYEEKYPEHATAVASLAFRLLEPSSPMEYCDSKEEYCYEIHKSRFCADQCQDMLYLLSRATVCGNISIGQSITSILRKALIEDSQDVIKMFSLPLTDAMLHAQVVRRYLAEKLADPTAELGLSKMSVEDVLNTLFSRVNELCLASFQFAVAVFSSLASYSSGELPKRVIEVVVQATKAAINRDCTFWPALISVLDISIAREIRQYAEDQLLNTAISHSNEVRTPEGFMPVPVERYLKVVSATSSSIPGKGQVETAKTIIARLRQVMEELCTSTEPLNPASANSPLEQRLCILLYLSVVHASSINSTTTTPSLRVQLLSFLSILIVHARSHISHAAFDHVFDTAATFTVDITGAELHQLSHELQGDVKHNPRIRFLFGFHDDPDGKWRLSSQAPEDAGVKTIPFQLRPWELLQDSTPNIGPNDTALSLRLFGARKAQRKLP